MIYYISLDEEIANILQEVNVDDLSNILNDEEELSRFKYALSKFQDAYAKAIDNDEYILTMEEQEQTYRHHADKCN